MHALLIGFGSAGDVLPLVGIGRALASRGHRVSVLANEHFGPVVARAGLRFIPFGTEAQYQQGASDPSGTHAIRGFRGLMKVVAGATRPLYEILEREYVPGETVAVATSLAFGARLAQEKLGLPLITAHLCPIAFRSDYDHIVIPSLPEARWAPRSLKRLLGWMGDVLVLDPPVEKELNAFSAELGLPPVRRPCHRWWNSPTQVLGLFPSWFGSPQPDWPARTQLVGFIRDPIDEEPPLAGEVEAFLAAGAAPVVFTPGSANRHGRASFETARRVCETLKVRGIFVTPFPDQVPERLPPEILHVRYAPFARLIPRAAALVHHGGIGTAVQAMAAGVPQLVVPVSYDQPDNASRLTHLGVARTLAPVRFRHRAVVRALRTLLASPDVAAACARVARHFDRDTAREDACALIEGMLAPPRASARRDGAPGEAHPR